eukprot:2722127-Prymnesium_polylepis.1
MLFPQSRPIFRPGSGGATTGVPLHRGRLPASVGLACSRPHLGTTAPPTWSSPALGPGPAVGEPPRHDNAVSYIPALQTLP